MAAASSADTLHTTHWSMHDTAESQPSQQQNDHTTKLDDEKRLETASEVKKFEKAAEKNENKAFTFGTQKPTGDAVDAREVMKVDNDMQERRGESSKGTGDGQEGSGEAKKVEQDDGDVEMKNAYGTGDTAPQTNTKGSSMSSMAMDVDNDADEKKKESSAKSSGKMSNGGGAGESGGKADAAEPNAGEMAKTVDMEVSGDTTKKKEEDVKNRGKYEYRGYIGDGKRENEARVAENTARSGNKTRDENEQKQDSQATAKERGSAFNGSGNATSTAAPPAASAAPPPPVLRGTLSYNIDLRRHIIRGMWNYENSTAFPPQRFELVRSLDKEEDPKVLPKDGEFHGSFSLAYFHTTSKGKQKERSIVIPESGVNIKFTEIDGKENEYHADGQGTNQFGVFNINGTATPSRHEGDATYDIVLRKRYLPSQVPVAPPTVASPDHGTQQSIKNKKRKHNEVGMPGDASVQDDKISEDQEGGPLPPPSQSYPSNVVCLRGKIYREETEEIGMSEVVHRISGMWSSGLDLILADPQNVRGLCNRFEYEHKSTLPNDRFPVSGRYSGWFDLSNPDNTRTRILEKDVTLKFRKNSAGFYNVEGRGSNAFGKYSITGTLTLDKVITIFRHFQQRKPKKNKETSGPTAVGSVTSAPGPLHGSGQSKVAATAAPAEPKLKLDDVTIPSDGDDSEKLASIPPPAHGTYSAVSRGVLRLNDDGAITCAGKWAMTREHFNNGQTSAFSFRLEPHYAAEAVVAMKKQKGDNTKETNKEGAEPSPVTSVTAAVATTTATSFPVDSAMYKGSFQMRKGPSKTTKVIDQQIVLKFRKNTAGSYNVYGKGINSIGEFNLLGTLILSGKSSGHVELYRIYPVPTPPPGQPVAAGPPGKVAGGKGPKLPTKENAAAKDATAASPGIVPGGSTMIPKPRPGLVRRESSRLVKLPSRLEDDDPQAQLSRIMDKCNQVLRVVLEKDIANGAFFREPVDPMALGIPTYHQVISEPMDLGTIQRKMDKGEISSPEEFGRLVRLVFENAMTFNIDPGHAVHQAGRNLLILFNQKFRDIERAVDNIRRNYKPSEAELKRKEKEEAKRLKRKAKEERKNKSAKKARLDEAQAMAAANASAMAAVVAAAPSNSSPGGSITRSEFNMLLQMIQQLQGQVVQTHTLLANLSPSNEHDDAASIAASVMSEGDSVFVPPSEVISSRPPASKGKTKKKGDAVAKADKAAPAFAMEEDKPLTLKEQEALTETINLLPEERLPGVIQIIRESTHLNGDEDEIDLEIDQLDTATQRKLQRYVLQVRLARLRWKDLFMFSLFEFSDWLSFVHVLLS